MAGLSQFYAPPSVNVHRVVADNALQRSDATVGAGTAQHRNLRDYAQRAIPGLTNQHATRGTFYGGQIGRQTDFLKQDTADRHDDIEQRLQRTLAGLRRSGVLAATGVML